MLHALWGLRLPEWFSLLAKAPPREALASDILALPLISFHLLRWNLSKFSQYLWKLSCRSFRSPKIVTKAVFSLFSFLCFLPLSQIWSYEIFLSTGTREGTNMFNGPANPRKFHPWKRDKSYSKDPYYLCRKTVRNGIKLRQDLYPCMRKFLYT